MIVEDSNFYTECSGYFSSRIFPYFRERLDAIKELKQIDADIRSMNSFARQMAAEGKLGRRVASIPYHIIEEGWVQTGNKYWFLDKKELHRFLKKCPEWSFVYN